MLLPAGRWLRRRTYLRFAAAGAFVGLAVMTSTRVARASIEFPERIRALLSLDCTPVCVLCHTTPDGGFGTIREPFGVYIQGQRVFFDLPAAFAAAEQDPNGDSDMDGINDVAEIRANTNPNMADTPDNPSDPICSAAEYGCGARIAPSGGSAPADRGWGLLAAFGVALLLFRKRRRLV